MRKYRELFTVMAGMGFAIGMMAAVQARAEEGEKCPHGKSRTTKDACCPAEQAQYTPELKRASKLEGMTVTSAEGKELGTLEHLAIDSRRGQVVYGIISSGGILDIGDEDRVVPWQLIKGSAKDDQLRASVSSETFKRAEAVTEERVANLGDRQWAKSTHDHFGVKPYWEMSRADAARRSSQKNQDRPERSQAQAQRAQARRDTGASEQPGQSFQATRRDRDLGQAGKVVLHDTLIGSTVKNSQGEELGELNDLMVDLQNGQVGYAILKYGGTLGIGGTLTAVPMERLDFRPQSGDDSSQVQAVASISKEELKNAPGFEEGQWPDMASQKWNREINAYYGSEPYYVVYGFVLYTADRETFADRQQVSLRGKIQSVDKSGAGSGRDEGVVQIQFEVEQDMSNQTAARNEDARRNQARRARAADQSRSETEAGQPRESDTERQSQQDVSGQSQQRRSGMSAGEGQNLEGRTITVRLAPESFLNQRDIDLSEGDQVTIKGALTSEGARTEVAAHTIQKDGKTVLLRTADGQPMWQGSSSDRSRDRSQDRNRTENDRSQENGNRSER